MKKPQSTLIEEISRLKDRTGRERGAIVMETIAEAEIGSIVGKANAERISQK